MTEAPQEQQPTWADYLVKLDPERAVYMVDSGEALGGERIMAIGHGWIALDQGAVDKLLSQPEDADGVISREPDGLQMWISGIPYPVVQADRPGEKLW